MPIIETSPEYIPDDPTPPLDIAHPLYKGLPVDTKLTPAYDVISQIGGTPWFVDDYFHGDVTTTSGLKGLNTNMHPVYQSYMRIVGMELRIQNDISSPTQDSRTKSFVVEGSATVFPFIRSPNEGDMFVVDIGDGYKGIFKVTSVTRPSIQFDSCHNIDYVLQHRFRENEYSPEYQDLISKTTRQYHYVRDFIRLGQDPLLVETDYKAVMELEQNFVPMVDIWLQMFFSDRYKTVVMPDQIADTYDPFVLGFFMDIVPTGVNHRQIYLRRYNLDSDPVFKAFNLFSYLLKRDKNYRVHLSKKMGLVSVRQFTSDALLQTIFYTGMSYVVAPTEPVVTVDYMRRSNSWGLTALPFGKSDDLNLPVADLIPSPFLNGLPSESAPLIHNVTDDDYYVLSKAFYTQDSAGQSILERCVSDYLNGHPPKLVWLKALCDSYHTWGALEKFYYIPILLLLMTAYIRSI